MSFPKTPLLILFLLGLSFYLSAQVISPVTPSPTVNATPLPGTNRIPTVDSVDVFPRWFPYTVIDPVLGGFFGITSRIAQAGVGIDSRKVNHFAGWEPVGAAPVDRIYYYNNDPGIKRNNGISEPFLLFEGAVSEFPFGVSTAVVDIACGEDDQIHVVWQVLERNDNGQIIKQDIYYQKKGVNGWGSALNVTGSTEPVMILCGTPPVTMVMDTIHRHSQPQVAIDQDGTAHIIMKYQKRIRESDCGVQLFEGLRYAQVANNTVILLEDVFPPKIIESPNKISEPRLDLNSLKQTFIVWTERDEAPVPATATQINYGIRTAPQTWTIMEDISEGPEEFSGDITIDGADSVHICWVEEANSVQYRRGINENLEGKEPIVEDAGVIRCRIGSDIQNQALVVWSNHAGPHGFALRSNHPALIADPWQARQDTVPIAQKETFTNLWPHELVVSNNDGVYLTLLAPEETQNVVFTQTIDFNLGLQDAYTRLSTAPNTDVNIVNGNINFALPLFSTYGAGYSTDFSLIYNSGDHRPSFISQGWMHNFDMYLIDSWTAIKEIATIGALGVYEDDISLFLRDGRMVDFCYNPEFGFHIAEDEFGNFYKLERPEITITPSLTQTDHTYRITTPHGIQYEFDENGRLIKMKDRNGNTCLLEYQNGKLVKIIDSVDRETTLSYEDGHLVKVTDPAGKEYKLSYNNRWQLETVEFKGAPADMPVVWKIEYHNDNEESPLFPEIPDVNNRECLISKIFTPRGNNEGYCYDCYYLPDGRCRLSLSPDADYMKENGEMENKRTMTIFSYLDSLPQHEQAVEVINPRGFKSKMRYHRRFNYCLEQMDEEEYRTFREPDRFRNTVKYTDPLASYDYEYCERTEATPPLLKKVIRPQVEGTGTYTALYQTFTDDGFNLVECQVDCQGDTTKYEYDGNGNLAKIIYPKATLPDGTIQTSSTVYKHNDMGEITEIIDPNGNKTIYSGFKKNPGSGQATVQLRDGTTVADTTVYDDDMGYALSQSFSGKQKTTYKYNGLDLISSIEMPSNDAGQRVIDISFNHDLQITGLEDQFGKLKTIQYDRPGFPICMINAVYDTMEIKYDEQHNEVATIDYKDIMHRMFWDPRDYPREAAVNGSRNIGETDLIHRISFQKDGNGNVTEQKVWGDTSVVDQITGFEWDKLNRLKRTNHPEDLIYDAQNYDCDDNTTELMRGKGSPGGTSTVKNKVTLVIDEVDRACMIKEKLGDTELVTKRYHDPGDRLTMNVDPLDRIRSLVYDVRDNPHQLLDHTGKILQELSFTNRDQVETVKVLSAGLSNALMSNNSPPMTTVVENEFDNKNLQVRQRDSYNNLVEVEWDIRDRIVSKIDEIGCVTKYDYDDLDRLVSITEGLGTEEEVITEYEYDPNSNLNFIRRYNPETGLYDAVYCLIYDNANRLIKMKFPEVAGLNGSQLEMTWVYNIVGNLVSFTDRNGKTTYFEYDRNNRRIVEKHHNPNNIEHNQRLEYDYDEADNVTEVIFRDGLDSTDLVEFRATYAYDDLNRMTDCTWYVGDSLYQSLHFEYDDASNLISFSDGTVTYYYDYDNNNYLRGMIGQDSMIVAFAYNDAGRRTAAYLGSKTVEDTLSAIAAIYYGYDFEQRPNQIMLVVDEDTLMHLVAYYDERDNRERIDFRHLDVSASFSYDCLNRLEGEFWQRTDSICVDLLPQIAAGVQTAALDFFPGMPNEGIETDTRIYSCLNGFDEAGNRIYKVIDGDTTFFYFDAQNRLTYYLPPDGIPVNYTNDPHGNQLTRERSELRDTFGYNYNYQINYHERLKGGATQYKFKRIFTPTGQALAEFDEVNQTAEWYHWRFNERYAEKTQEHPDSVPVLRRLYLSGLSRNEKWGRILYDSVGTLASKDYNIPDFLRSVSGKIDTNGTVIFHNLKNAWGEKFPESFITFNNSTEELYSGIAGAKVDTITGGENYYWRWYDPATGRFNSTDPIISNQPTDHGSYASNNPVMNTDVMGLQDDCTCDYSKYSNPRARRGMGITRCTCPHIKRYKIVKRQGVIISKTLITPKPTPNHKPGFFEKVVNSVGESIKEGVYFLGDIGQLLMKSSGAKSLPDYYKRLSLLFLSSGGTSGQWQRVDVSEFRPFSQTGKAVKQRYLAGETFIDIAPGMAGEAFVRSNPISGSAIWGWELGTAIRTGGEDEQAQATGNLLLFLISNSIPGNKVKIGKPKSSIQLSPKSNLTVQQLVSGISDDAIVNFGKTMRSTVNPPTGKSYWFRFGDIKNYTPKQIEGIIGSLASGGESGGVAVIRISTKPASKFSSGGALNLAEIPEFIIYDPVEVRSILINRNQ